MKQRVYIDTSVIGGCFDEEFETWSNQFFKDVREGNYILLISDITYRELELAPKNVTNILFGLNENLLEQILTNPEVEELATEYINAGAISQKYYEDALHIAIATIQKADILISWNFKHIVNLNRIRKYNAVNLMFGYNTLEIRSPREILKDNEYED